MTMKGKSQAKKMPAKATTTMATAKVTTQTQTRSQSQSQSQARIQKAPTKQVRSNGIGNVSVNGKNRKMPLVNEKSIEDEDEDDSVEIEEDDEEMDDEEEGVEEDEDQQWSSDDDMNLDDELEMDQDDDVISDDEVEEINGYDEDVNEVDPETSEKPSNTFGSTLNALLTRPVDAPVPILAAATTIASKEYSQLQRERKKSRAQIESAKAMKQQALMKKLWREKEHKIPLKTPEERIYKQIATKGVVQLFNAIGRTQREIRQKNEDIGSLSARLQSSATQSARQPSLHDDEDDDEMDFDASDKVKEETKTKESSNPGWAILKEDYLMNNKLRDWDRLSEDEHEPERELEK